MLPLIVAFAILALLPLIGWILQQRGSRADARRFPPPGQLISVGTHRLHCQLTGESQPTVVFDSALASSSISWSLVQPQVAEFAQTLLYDRAGCGWSDRGPLPRDLPRIVDELKALLDAAGTGPPYILVGHSYGGLTARCFASRYPEQTAGLVLVDAADLGQWVDPTDADQRKISSGARLARRGVWLGHVGIPRAIVCVGRWGALDGAKKVAGWLGGGMKRPAQDQLVSPMLRLPETARRQLHWFWTEPAFFESIGSQIEHVPGAAKIVADSPIDPNLPVSVVAADNGQPEWIRNQKKLAQLTSRGMFHLATESSHWIPLDRPDVVVEGIRRVVDIVRAGS